jgi:hypothetical protein
VIRTSLSRNFGALRRRVIADELAVSYVSTLDVSQGFEELVSILSGGNESPPRGLWGFGADVRKVGKTYCLWHPDKTGGTKKRYFRDPYHAVLAFLRHTGFPNRVWISMLKR